MLTCYHGMIAVASFLCSSLSLTAPLSTASRRYADKEKQTSCISCPGGSASEAGAFECGDCFAGTIESGVGVCTPCPSGQWSEKKTSVCIICEPGKSSLPGEPKCSACDPGTFRKGEQVPAAGVVGAAGAAGGGTHEANQTNETSKRNGTANEMAGATTSIDETTSNCTSCAVGRYSAAQASECTLCKAGQYLGTVKGIACTLCPKGTYLNAEGKTLKRHCKPCAAGRFNPIQGANRSSWCQNCSAGQYGNETSQVGPEACKLCPAGRVGTDTGMASSNCSGACGLGDYSKAGDSECRTCGISEFSTGAADACTPCETGETTILKRSSKCVCARGFFANPVAAGTNSCTVTTAGGIQPVNSTLFPAVCCTKCPPGFVCDRAGVVVSNADLKPGFWRSDTGSLRALPCPSRDSCGGTGGCALGHEGPFCSVCSANYTRHGESSGCQPCPSKEDAGSAITALVVIVVVCTTVVVLYALFNHRVPKGLLKPFINGTKKEERVMLSLCRAVWRCW